MGVYLGVEPFLRWVFWQPRVKLVAEKVGTHSIRNDCVQAIVQFKLANTGRTNAVDPRIRVDLPHWNFGKRQSGLKFTSGRSVADLASDRDTDSTVEDDRNKHREDEKLGLNFSDCQVNAHHDRTPRFGGGEVYNINIEDVIPKNDPVNICFGYVLLDQGQSNTLEYTLSTENQGPQTGTITFSAGYNDIEIDSLTPSIWSERYTTGKTRVNDKSKRVMKYMFGQKETGNVEFIEPRNTLYTDESTGEQWYLPVFLIRLSPRVNNPCDLTAKLDIAVDQGEGYNTVGAATLRAYSISPGEYWETIAPERARGLSSFLIESDTSYGQPLDPPLPIPLSDLGKDIGVSDLRIEWDVSEDEMRSQDNRQLEFYDCELVSREIPRFQGKVRNENRTSRSPFIGAKFYAETNEILYTPTKTLYIDGDSSRDFQFEFRAVGHENRERVAKCEPFFQGTA